MRLVTEQEERDFQLNTCRTCVHLSKIMKHPWNKQDFAKGRISEMIGYGCSVFNEELQRIVFYETDAVSCELHTLKEKQDEQKQGG